MTGCFCRKILAIAGVEVGIGDKGGFQFLNKHHKLV
jgi:hypothetical protein